jgi:hypothetical protein
MNDDDNVKLTEGLLRHLGQGNECFTKGTTGGCRLYGDEYQQLTGNTVTGYYVHIRSVFHVSDNTRIVF